MPTDTALCFDGIVEALDYPLLIATTTAGGERAGCLVGFAMQSSILPRRFVVCLSRNNRTCRLASQAEALAIHCVSEREACLAELFGGKTGDEVDKFDRCDWSAGPLDLPVLDGVPAWFAGTIESREDSGDHVAHLLAPVAGELRRDFEPLPTSALADIEAGHEA
jgi:flavin reductase (DIM6/NTAB) family NADH-FMN oxidoreductase RutF